MKKYYEKHPYQGDLISARQISILSGYHYDNVTKLLRRGFTSEQIISREHKWASPTLRKGRKVPLFHFRRIEDLCTYLGISRQRLYQKIANGEKLEEIDNIIQFV